MSVSNVVSANLKEWMNGKFNDLEAVTFSLGGTSIHDLVKNTLSAGIISGFNIAFLPSGEVSIGAGECYLRSADTDVSTIQEYSVALTPAFTLVDNDLNIIYVDYNAGVPVVGSTVLTTVVNNNTIFGLYKVYRDGTFLTIQTDIQYQNQISKRTQEFLDAKFGQTRTDGLVLGETGTRRITVTAGTMWKKLNERPFPYFDSSASDTFKQYYRTGAVYTEVSGATAWDNAQYNDTAVGLVAMTVLYFSYQEFYVASDNTIHSVYAENEYADEATAESGPIVPMWPQLADVCTYIGRIVFQILGATAFAILSPFSTNLDPVSSVGIHSHLSQLTSDDHLQYLLLTGRGGQSINDSIEITGTTACDTIDEYSSGVGVTIEDILIKDGQVEPLADMGSPAGFVSNTAQASTYTDGTRTFEISPTAGSFFIYSDGIKYEISGAESVVSANTEGLHIFYYDGNTLSTLTSWTGAQIKNIIVNKCICAFMYWDLSAGANIYFTENNEYHGISMAGITHYYLHTAIGTKYNSGMALADILVDQSGAIDTHAQFSVALGVMADEDLTIDLSAVTSTTALPVFNRVGSDWERTITPNFSVRHVPGGRLYYDNTGTITEVGNNQFVLYHVFATNDGMYSYFSIMGQSTYATANLARDGADTEINNMILTGLPFSEMIPVGTIIYQTATAYTNGPKARIRSDGDGNDYVDWRFATLSKTIQAQSHGSLSNLSVDDHSQYIIIDSSRGAQDIDSTVTMTSCITDTLQGETVAHTIDMSGTDIELNMAGTGRVVVNGNATSGDCFLELNRDALADTNVLSFDSAGASEFKIRQILGGRDLQIYNENTSNNALTIDYANNGVTIDTILYADTIIGSTVAHTIDNSGANMSLTCASSGSFLFDANSDGDSLLRINKDALGDDASINFTEGGILAWTIGIPASQDGFSLYSHQTADFPLFVIKATGYIQSTTIYANALSGQADVHITAGGILGRDSCLTELKMDISDLPPTDALYDIQVKQYKARGRDPVTNELTDVPLDGKIIYGCLAEGIVSVDNNLATYDLDQNLVGINKNSILFLAVKTIQKLKEQLDAVAQIVGNNKNSLDQLIARITSFCRVATVVDMILTGIQQIDGITLAVNDKVLVKDQTDKTQNGIYIAQYGAWQKDISFEYPGSKAVVLEGAINSDKTFLCITDPGTEEIEYQLE